jgi:hypothetical protein
VGPLAADLLELDDGGVPRQQLVVSDLSLHIGLQLVINLQQKKGKKTNYLAGASRALTSQAPPAGRPALNLQE